MVQPMRLRAKTPYLPGTPLLQARRSPREGWCRICGEREADESYLSCESCRFDEMVQERVARTVWCEDCQIGVNTEHGHRYDCPGVGTNVVA